MPPVLWVSFPGAPYTHQCARRAAEKLLRPAGWEIRDTTSEKRPDTFKLPDGADVYLAGYDVLPFESLLGSQALCSSYVIRKALIRKHHLAHVLHAFSVKNPTRPVPAPRTWTLDLQFADELDELLSDDLYDVREALERNDTACPTSWFILKPGMADQGNGIRLFSSVEQLEHIFQAFEDDDDDEEAGITSQLRHFVIQDYISAPLLVAPDHTARKFHLRVYVICVGGLHVYMHDDMLALFSDTEYAPPTGEMQDLRGHLTNTCYQNGTEKENVYLWRDLVGQPACLASERFTLTQAHIDAVRLSAAATIGAIFEAVGREASFHWQMWPNAFEIFGVDLLVGHDASKPHALCTWLLEINAVRTTPLMPATGLCTVRRRIRACRGACISACAAASFGARRMVRRRKSRSLYMLLQRTTRKRSLAHVMSGNSMRSQRTWMHRRIGDVVR